MLIKKIIIGILIFVYISISYTSFSKAKEPELTDCSWTKLETWINTITYETTKTKGGCVDGKLLQNDQNCLKLSNKPETNLGAAGGTDYVCCCNANYGEDGSSMIIDAPLFKAPDLQIKIPGMDELSDIDCSKDETCEIPWLGQYIKGIYNYAIAIAGILAAVVMMGGGVLWLISRGEASQITKAKELIFGSIVGLIILTGSYLILTLINPNLTKMPNLKITQIEKIDLSDLQDADMTTLSGLPSNHKPYAAECEASKNDYTQKYLTCEKLGEEKPGNLTEINGVLVNSEVAEKYLKAMECVKNKNNGSSLFKIREGWRSPKKQVEYRKAYDQAIILWLKKGQEGQKPKPVALPCCSNHGSGVAMDINRLDGNPMSFDFNDKSGLTECMNTQGLQANLKSEPWHWSPSGY